MTQKTIASIVALASALVCTAAETQSGQTANAAAKPRHDVEFVFISETTDGPEDVWMKKKLEPAIREWCPKLIDMFPVEGGLDLPKKITFNIDYNLDYDLPESCRTYLLFEPNFDEDVLGTNPFSTCPSKPLVGKGSGERYFLLGDRQYGDNGQLVRDGKYEKDLLGKSAKDEGE